MDAILQKRLVFVTGKGGVGKTTVAAALGLAAARAGRRTLVCEVAEQERITRLFGREPAGYDETPVAENLSAFSVNPDAAKREWLGDQLRSGRLASMLGRSRIFTYLAAAAPGLDELVTLGKIWELAQLERRNSRDHPYDLVVVDAPSTGHGIALLRAPRTYADIAKVGPIRRHATHIADFMTDARSTAVVAVALPEEMPVNETIDLQDRLREQAAIELATVLVNAVMPERFSAGDAERLEAERDGGGRASRQAVATALEAHSRARDQRAQVGRLRRGVQAPVLTLPLVTAPADDRAEVDALADELERKL
jgi:anion-transporting  ArsA/GET3 family ATPase